MYSHKYLYELLQEDQDPLPSHSHIADIHIRRKPLLSKPQRTKQKPIKECQRFTRKSCFHSFQPSPDARLSPLLDFSAPVRRPNKIFLQIPAKTAALLLEAALRIQKQSSGSSKKPKSCSKSSGFGVFGSILKRLKNRSRKCDLFAGQRKSCNNGSEKMLENLLGRSASERHSSFTSSSSSNVFDDSREFEISAYDSCESAFYESPFRFVLQRSRSSGSRSPEGSPGRRKNKGKENYEAESLKKFEIDQEEEEEEREQCSPVSVLDPPFENYDDAQEHGDDNEIGEDSHDLERSYAVVQRAKQQLLHKLHRFEKLAELDPIELEKRMQEEEEEVENNVDCQGDSEEDEDRVFQSGSQFSVKTNVKDDFVVEILSKWSSCENLGRTPTDMKKLISDLITEEQQEESCCSVERDSLAKRVCERLESWKEVESNTIDMMVELDFRSELDGWKKNQEQVVELAGEIEPAVFGLLVEELTGELDWLAGK